jgi:phosphatidylethanolamine/phosphatidyl-N-methylethanolamine N-methyltransferase
VNQALMWNRIRYTIWAPFYDPFVAAVGFDAPRRRSIDHLRLEAGHRVLIVGAGTGQDLAHLPPGVEITAIDVTPAMLSRLRRRAFHLGLSVTAQVMDARRLEFEDSRFDAIILHLILAVMPEPERGLAEAIRVLKPGGRIAVFDKFLGDEQKASVPRRLLNLVMKPLCTDMNRKFGPLIRPTGLEVERDEPAAFGGMYRLIALRKPDNR